MLHGGGHATLYALVCVMAFWSLGGGHKNEMTQRPIGPYGSKNTGVSFGNNFTNTEKCRPIANREKQRK